MNAPFDTDKLDALMDRQGLDALIATSKHNVQYLMGGYRFFFFDCMDAIGLSRYLPVFVYMRGRPAETAYFGNAMERFSDDAQEWPPRTGTSSWGTMDAIGDALDHLRTSGISVRRLGVEMGFLPADAYDAVRSEFGNTQLIDCVVTLEQLRAVKTPAELALLRTASENTVASMVAVMEGHGAGTVKRDLVEALRREETARGLQFEYCLCTMGMSLDRAPSDQVWQDGDIISIDSGSNYRGYIGDLCRMGVLGEPDSELEDLLAEIDAIQQAARKKIGPDSTAANVIEAGQKALAASPNRDVTDFVAHGMGLVSHEAPRMTDKAPVPYPAEDADKPLKPGMVTSVETTMAHPRRGIIKLEDTVIVTDTGSEGLGDTARGWTRAGTAL